MLEIEKLLSEAALDLTKRDLFEKKLLQTDVIVLGEILDEIKSDTKILNKNSKFTLVTFEDEEYGKMIPFFSSNEKIQKFKEEFSLSKNSTIVLDAKSLFELTRGAVMYFNPGSDYNVSFIPPQIDNILNRSLNNAYKDIDIGGVEISLFAPNYDVSKLTKELSKTLTQFTNIKKGYLALIKQKTDNEPHFIIGIQGTEIHQFIKNEIGRTALNILGNQIIDIYEIIESDDGLSLLFKENIEPFYTSF